MSRTIIWTRHGIVDSENDNYDTLTNDGLKLSAELEAKLGGLTIGTVVYITIGRTREPIDRCRATVSKVQSNEVIGIEDLSEIAKIIDNRSDNILICYTIESLKTIPCHYSLLSAMREKEIIDEQGAVINKDRLYKIILFTEYDAGIFSNPKIIDTGHEKIRKKS